MKDKSGRIIYVGKAKVLKNRVRQYFQNIEEKDPKTAALVKQIHHIETIVTKTEAEALILENTLIKMHKPRYNILLKDDKTYPYIRITAQEAFPRIEFTRTIHKDGSKYFGAYIKPADVRKSIELIRKIFPVRTCKRQIEGKENQRACLFYHIGLCAGPCAGKINQQDYQEIVREACKFLEGRQEEITNSLQKKMQEHAENLEFEKAAAVRDKLKSISTIAEKQVVLSTKQEDRDLCALARDKINSIVTVLFVRSGKLMGKSIHVLENTYDLQTGEVLESFITQFYGSGREIPPEILFSEPPSNQDILGNWLSGIKGKAVKLIHPLRGDKRNQIELAIKNATEEFDKYRIHFQMGRERIQQALEKLGETLQLEDLPIRIEAYDISNIGNQGMVGAMVVFIEGEPTPRQYRKFTIKNVEKQNDYACMQEVLFRRLKRLNDSSRDESFLERPDLILIDGGMGHVHAVQEVLREMNMSIPLFGMAKNDKHQTSQLLNDQYSIELRQEPALLSLISAIQEEVHRFAIRFHRDTRHKGQSRSRLDEIQGIGPQKKKALLKAFGSVKRIREAEIEELCKIKGIHPQLAQEIKNALEEM